MVSINYRKQTIDKILFNLFNGTDTDFEIDNRKVLLFKRQKIGEVPTTTIQEEVQTIINGTVKDLGGVPVPGANIVEKGTTNGAQTDFDGNFYLEPQGENPVLVISYVGFATQEIVVGSQTNLNIVLQEDATGLEEVVLIGYASVAKRDVTGSVSTVEAESFNQGVVSSQN